MIFIMPVSRKQKKGLIKANFDRLETPKGEFGCVRLADFCETFAVR